VENTIGQNTSASSGIPSKLPSLRLWAMLKPRACLDTYRKVACLSWLYTWEYTAASPIENTWQGHLNATVIPGGLARSECSESGGMTRTLRIQNFLILLWISSCVYKTHRNKIPSIRRTQLLTFYLYWNMGSNRVNIRVFALYSTLLWNIVLVARWCSLFDRNM
jgi:hypothetical protein